MIPPDQCNGEIFIVDSNAAVRDSLAQLLTLAGYQVTAFGDGQSFITATRIRLPTCVLLDVGMPDKSGLDILTEVDARNYPAPIVIMSDHGNIQIAVEAIKAGACDFIEKQLHASVIVARLRETIDGWACRRQPVGNRGKLLPTFFPGSDRLTRRERDVLRHIAAAASSKEAAKRLGISPRTVEIYRSHIMQKLGAKNAVDLVRMVLSS